MLAHSIIKLVLFVETSKKTPKAIAFNWSIQIFLILVILLHAPVVIMQLRLQLAKLCKNDDNLNATVDELTSTNMDFENDLLKLSNESFDV